MLRLTTAFGIAIAALWLSAAAQAEPFAKADPKTGKKLLDEAKCSACHASRMGGDGSRMFTRPEHKVNDAQSLLKMVQFCVDRTGDAVFPEDVIHIAAYLNQQYYKFQK
jgi:mono/diheme cytochrome c family protein